MESFANGLAMIDIVWLGIGLISVALLAVLAARLSKIIDLLDELAEMITTSTGKIDDNET